MIKAIIKAAQIVQLELDNSFEVIHRVSGVFINGQLVPYTQENNIIIIDSEDDLSSEMVHVVYNFHFAEKAHSDDDNIYWEGGIESSSEFGTEIDFLNQTTEAIEGKGSLNIISSPFWRNNIDELIFDNQECLIYNNEDLLFKGKIESVLFRNNRININIKDAFSDLKNNLNLETFKTDKIKRLIYGKNKELKLSNISYEKINSLSGTIAIPNDSVNVTGTSTSFLTYLSPNDKIYIQDEAFTIASISSNTALTISKKWTKASVTSEPLLVSIDRDQRWQNRVYNIAGHSLRQPEVKTMSGCTIDRLRVESTRNIYPGDAIWLDSPINELVFVNRVLSDRIITLRNSLASAPDPDVIVVRPCVQNLTVDGVGLRYKRDYEVDAINATLTLNTDAEENAGEIRQRLESATFTNGSRDITGTGLGLLKPGDKIRRINTTTWVEVMSGSDSLVQLRSAWPGTTGSGVVQYSDFIVSNGSTIYADALGGTEDGLPSGTMPLTASSIVKDLIKKQLGLEISIKSSSNAPVYYANEFESRTKPTIKDVVNSLNKSVFGVLYQNDSFILEWDSLKPRLPVKSYNQFDFISFSYERTNKYMLSSVIAEYDSSDISDANQYISTSSISTNIIKTFREKIFNTLLSTEVFARIFGERWQWITQKASISAKFSLPLKDNLKINDTIYISHPDLGENRVFIVERVLRGSKTQIEATNIGGQMHNVAFIDKSKINQCKIW